MWCINLSNLATWVLWVLAAASFVGVVCLMISVHYLEIMIAMWKQRIWANENDIASLKVDVRYSMKKEVK